MAKKVSNSEKKVRQIRRKSRKQYSGEEKIRIDRIQRSATEFAWGALGGVSTILQPSELKT